MTFTEKESSDIKKITELYLLFKKLMLSAEEFDEYRRSKAQAVLELRNALDHLMRVLCFKFGLHSDGVDEPCHGDMADLKQVSAQEYLQKNIDKVYGHVYRAGYDVLDWMGLTLRDRIDKKMKKFSNQAKVAVFPEYFTKIRPEIYTITKAIADARNNKDVDLAPINDTLNVFTKYVDQINKLYDLFNEKIEPMTVALQEYENRRVRDKILYTLLTSGIAIAVSVITWYLTEFK